MRSILRWVVIAALVWFGYTKYQEAADQNVVEPSFSEPVERTVPIEAPREPRFSCDGRTHCSHMTSCAEAKYFIRNCPNTEMDGDNDGIPCERQWCKM